VLAYVRALEHYATALEQMIKGCRYDTSEKERSTMHITQITVSYGETQSLPEYSNVKPNVTLTATLDEGDSPEQAEAALWTLAKQSVHEQIDLALELNGKAAKYSAESRYQVMQTYWNEWDHRGQTKPPQYVVILPNELSPGRDAYAQRLIHAGHSTDARKLRYSHALQIAEDVMREHADYTLLDCASGDLTALNLALSAPEYTPTEPPAQHPIDAQPDAQEEWVNDDLDEEDDE
jgi:hypothetical protein